MPNLTLNLDEKAEKNINRLKKRYGVSSKAEVIRKALTLLSIVARNEDEKGELLMRKGDKDTKIIFK